MEKWTTLPEILIQNTNGRYVVNFAAVKWKAIPTE